MRIRELPAARLFTTREVRALDQALIDVDGIPGIVLMKRAAQAVLNVMRARLAPASVSVLCGHGNNAGDGYLVAALARDAGLDVQLVAVGDPERLGGDAARACDFARERHLDIEPFASSTTLRGEVIVDALLGIGASGPLREPFAAAVRCINAQARPVVAVDVPTGLDADTGTTTGDVVQATLTVCFVGIKRGLLTGRGPAVCGEVWFDNLGAGAASGQGGCEWLCFGPGQVPPPRQRDAHKGSFGHLLIIGGSRGMGGAGLLAAEGALRAGSGLVTLACDPTVVGSALARRPEAMATGVASAADLEAPLARADVIVVGPGLGRDARAQALFSRALIAPCPLVIDADALTLLAEAPRPLGPAVLTPHPGEAARLLGVSTADVQRDRFAAAETIARRYGAVTLLKGAGTIVTDANHTTVIGDGNPGMATGGMGDVLAGVIGALLAQGLAPFAAARLGACVHAAAADRAAQSGERGLLAADLFPWLRTLLNGKGTST